MEAPYHSRFFFQASRTLSSAFSLFGNAKVLNERVFNFPFWTSDFGLGDSAVCNKDSDVCFIIEVT